LNFIFTKNNTPVHLVQFSVFFSFLGLELPDLSKPPPGFPLPPVSNPVPPEVSMDELMPSVPYFELPAGLMVPLIKVMYK
jgi:hypothetical protein